MNIQEKLRVLGNAQSNLFSQYNVPSYTIQSVENELERQPLNILDLLACNAKSSFTNQMTAVIPRYDPEKEDLPRRTDFVGAISWLRAIQEQIGEPFIFALDEALMCQGRFCGRSDEYIVWGYGSNSVSRYNGIVLLGENIPFYDVICNNGLSYTDFNRTLIDALANEPVLDMQGITEALSSYYYTNNNSFDGIFVLPEYREKFSKLAKEAIEYYDY